MAPQDQALSPGRSRSGPGRVGGENVDEWVADLRRVCLDNLAGMQRRHPTLKERLFPLSSTKDPRMRDVLYAESVWATGTLVVSFVAYLATSGSAPNATAFVLLVSLMLVPVLLVWAALGYYYVRAARR